MTFPIGYKIRTGFGRVVATCLGGRKWEIHVDGQHMFTTSRGMTGVQKRLDFEVDRIDGPLHNDACTCSACWDRPASADARQYLSPAKS